MIVRPLLENCSGPLPDVDVHELGPSMDFASFGDGDAKKKLM